MWILTQRQARRGLVLGALLLVAPTCAHRDLPAPPEPGSPAAAVSESGPYLCTQVTGVSATGEWYEAGFEEGLDAGRWQTRWRKQAFVDRWADRDDPVWSLPPRSPCAENAANPDRVIFVGVNWQFTTRGEWESALRAVVKTLRGKYSALRRIDLLTMLRGPKNLSCGSPMTVVQPHIDEAIAAVAAEAPGLVFAGPRVEAQRCAVFTKGGPHFTPEGTAEVARLYRNHLAPPALAAARWRWLGTVIE